VLAVLPVLGRLLAAPGQGMGDLEGASVALSHSGESRRVVRGRRSRSTRDRIAEREQLCRREQTRTGANGDTSQEISAADARDHPGLSDRHVI
jgi:hypothetical protein